jgi:hypothetical protein
MKKLLILCALVLAAALVYAIPHETGNAVSTSDTAATVLFRATHGTLLVTNTGTTDAIYVRLWQGCETPATITTSTAGVAAIQPSATVTFFYDQSFECGGGYQGFSYIMASGKTSTMNYIAK